MGTSSRKESRIFFSYNEVDPGTADSDEFFEGNGMMDLPEPERQYESDKGKLGSGEHGTKTELQALWTPWTYNTQRLSEIAYLLSYFQGAPDNVSGAASVYQHEMNHLGVTQRQLPTFTIEYGNGTTNQKIVGNIVNEFSISLSSGGTGIVEASFSGFGNRHYVSGGSLTALSTGSMSTGENDFSSEPLVNFKACDLWMADALEGSFGFSSVDFSNHDLGASTVKLTEILNSITISGNNGVSAEERARAGGGGIINDFNRGDRSYTLEMNLRKDTGKIDAPALALADTQKSFELLFSGPEISASNPYALDLFFPVVQVLGSPEDGSSPINQSITTEVFDDSNDEAFKAYVQSSVSVGYNSNK